MIALDAPPPARWQWPIMAPLLRTAFAPIPDEPLPIWASKNVFLDRKVTTKPGFYDPDEFPWTWEMQEIIRTRTNPWTGQPVTRCSVMKSSVTGFTEGFLNGIRWIAKNDPQNVIFAIDSIKEAANINENRLRPSLKRLGEEIFTGNDDDLKRFMLNLRRMLVYFLGSYSEAAFANKMCELAGADELEEHGDPNTIENLESRLKSAARPLLILLSKPKLKGGPIDAEFEKGTMHVYEVPCPHCGFYQQLLQEQMMFDHCRDLYGDWDFAKVETDTFFRCLNPECKKPIEESWKRWLNDRSRRRWRQTNPNPEPGHVSFHISDFYGFHPDARWGKLAVKYIKSKGDPEARKSYRNHHEGYPWEVRATRTGVEDILSRRGTYKRLTIPWKPRSIILGADIGQNYAKWSAVAFRFIPGGTECAVVDWGVVTHPKHLMELRKKRYISREDAKEYRIACGFADAHYDKEEVNKACYHSNKWLWPCAGINDDLSVRSISMNHVAGFPQWYRAMIFSDRDAKTELYCDRITEWVEWEKTGKLLPLDDPARKEPEVPPLWFPEDLRKDDQFLLELTTERLVELTTKDKGWMPHTARQFVWKRKGANHFGDTVKIALAAIRMFTRETVDKAPALTTGAQQ